MIFKRKNPVKISVILQWKINGLYNINHFNEIKSFDRLTQILDRKVGRFCDDSERFKSSFELIVIVRCVIVRH